MGVCQGDSSKKEHELAVGLAPEDLLLEEKGGRPSSFAEPDEATKKLMNQLKQDQVATGKIVKLQAWVRGTQCRKLNVPNLSKKSVSVIKYISSKLPAPSDESLKVEQRLGPYIFDWDYADFGDIELRKETMDENGGVYIGYWNNQTNVKEGYGQQIFQTGAKYEGLWRDNTPEGEGRYIYENGDYYVGNRVKGKAHGQGSFVTNEGDSYTGQWLDDLYNGKGREEKADGSVYDGDFKMGKKEGNGKFTWPDGSTYEGSFVQNMICGEGEYKSSNGMMYKGEWKDNKRNGKGVFKFPDGKVYEGEFANDLRHGYGTMTW